MFENVKAQNARIFGSDDDSVAIGDSLEFRLPEGLEPLGEDFTEVGWLGDEGIGFSPEDSVDKFYGHQGGRVVRTKMTSSETTFTFQALESKLSHVGLAMSIKNSETTVEGDATIHTMGGVKSCVARSWLTYDGNTTGGLFRLVRSVNATSSPCRTLKSLRGSSMSRSLVTSI